MTDASMTGIEHDFGFNLCVRVIDDARSTIVRRPVRLQTQGWGGTDRETLENTQLAGTITASAALRGDVWEQWRSLERQL